VWYPYAGWSLHTDTTPPQPHCNVTPTHIEPDTTHEVTQRIIRRLLRMDVLTSETCWELNKVIKQVASSWSLFTQLIPPDFSTLFLLLIPRKIWRLAGRYTVLRIYKGITFWRQWVQINIPHDFKVRKMSSVSLLCLCSNITRAWQLQKHDVTLQ